MRTRGGHARRPDGAGVRRRPDCAGHRATAIVEPLLRPHELYVGHLGGPRPGLWRMGLMGDGLTVLGGEPPQGGDDALLRWAARELLRAALRRPVRPDAVRALAAELPGITGAHLELSDLEVRLWFLAWGLKHG